jgi:hypothetical protein
MTMLGSRFARWLIAPPLAGRVALLSAILALSISTVVRAAIDPFVTGCEFTPYLPFVLLAAILLPWWEASLVALAVVPILGLMFVGTPTELAASTCFLSSAGIFLAASAGAISFVVLIRRLVVSIQRSGDDESAGGILFSLDQGQVWASWYGRGPRVLLGSREKVSGMMQDFLAQGEVAKRLLRDRE